MAILTTLRGEIHNSMWHKLQNSMEVERMGIIAILTREPREVSASDFDETEIC